MEKIKLEVKLELQHLHAVIPNKLAFTSFHFLISKYTLKGRNNSDASETSFQLRSDKPSHKHDSNKYQTKAFVICNHKSDQNRSATHVFKNKTHQWFD